MPELFTTLTHASDRREPRLKKAFIKATKQMRRSVSLEKLTQALETGDVVKVMTYVNSIDLEKPLGPVAGITKDAFIKGGQSAAKTV